MNERPAPAAYRYPLPSLVPDGLRALAGLALTGVPLVALPVLPWLAVVLAGGVVMFGVFGVLTALRVRTRVRVDDDGIEAVPGPGRLSWSQLRVVKLRYFAVRRERERGAGHGRRHGWMHLVLAGDGGRLRIDSRLDGFDEVLRQVAGAVSGRTVDPVTRSNFEAAGLALAEGAPEEDHV